MKSVIIKNDSSLTFSCIGQIIDRPGRIFEHLNEPIFFEGVNGIRFNFVLEIIPGEIDTWHFKNVRS